MSITSFLSICPSTDVIPKINDTSVAKLYLSRDILTDRKFWGETVRMPASPLLLQAVYAEASEIPPALNQYI